MKKILRNTFFLKTVNPTKTLAKGQLISKGKNQMEKFDISYLFCLLYLEIARRSTLEISR